MHRVQLLRVLKPWPLLLALLFISQPSWPATVQQVKGKSVIIELDELELVAGDKVRALIDGKAKAIIQIKQVKGAKALGLILKGATQVGAEIEPPKKKSAGKANSHGQSHEGTPDGSMFIGGLGGYSMDTQSVKLSSETVSMTGSGYSAKALLDYTISGDLGLVARTGVELFKAAGTAASAACKGGTGCSTEITYLTGDLFIRYNLMDGGFTPYVAGGFGIHFPLAKQSNILDESRISVTTVFMAAIGAYFKAGSALIPVQIEYGYFPPSAEVTTTLIALRAGYTIPF